MSTCELTILQGPPASIGRVFVVLADQSRTIGRSSVCDLRLDEDEMISGMHAQVVHQDGWKVRDLLSRNGVLVNEKTVHERALEPGDRIQIGHTLFEFRLSGAGGTPAAAGRAAPELRVIKLGDDDGEGSEEVDPLRQTKMWTGPMPTPGDGGPVPLGRLIEKRADMELAKLALKNSVLNHAQIKECVDIQKEMRDVKIAMTLEEIFQEREYLTKEQIQTLVREYKYTRRRTKDLVYAEVATGNKLVPKKQIEECLKLQEQAFQAGDKIPYLGELLVKKGYISIRDNNRVIKAIKQYKEDEEARSKSGRHPAGGETKKTKARKK